MAVIERHGFADYVKNAFSAGRLRARAGFSAGSLSQALIVRLTELILVVILGIMLAQIFLSFVAPLPLPQGDATAAIPGRQQDMEERVVKSPFPATVLDAAPLETALAVSETALDLTLTGVWADAEEGSATIRTPDGKQSRFAVGDTIVSGVTLEAVFPDQVVINTNGVREALRFESKAMSGETPPVMVEPRGRQNTNAPLKSVTSASIGNLASILRVAPTLDSNGKLVVEVYAAKNRAAFTAFGFKDGDRLVSIDGRATPTKPTALSAVLSEIQRKDETVIVVERDGKKIPISVSFGGLGIQ